MRIFRLILFCAAALTLAAPVPLRAQSGNANSNLVMQGIPAIPPEVHHRLLPYLNVRGASLADWLPDGSGLMIATRFGNVPQLHIVTQPMGARRQVTFYDDPVTNGEFGRASDPNKILFTSFANGTEIDQIYLHDLRTGRATLLSDGRSVNRSPVWANKSSRYAFRTTKRNGVDFDIHVADADYPSSGSRPVIEAGGSWLPLDFSPDDSRLLVMKYISVNESQLFVADLNSTATIKINGSVESPVSYGTGLFSRDGEGVFYTSDHDSEFQRLLYYDLRHQVSKPIATDLSWDIESIALSDDGRYLAFKTNENGFSQIYLLNTKTLAREQLSIPPGIVGSLIFHPKEERIAFSLNSSTQPGDIYVYDIRSKELVRWTQSEVGGLPESTFVSAEVVAYRTFDQGPDGAQRRIPAYVYKPKTAGPWPVLIDIHGGPESQERPWFDSLRQFLVNELGIAVIAPNVRGSAGYGKQYLQLDNGARREDSVKDIGALLNWLKLQPEFDEKRIAVMGGSYGGYMVLASMAAYPDRIACGIDVVGISNFVTFLESTGEYRRDLRRAEYGDERDPAMRELLINISPTTNASKIMSPLFVVQGANDPRVPRSEAEQIVQAVRANGQPVWYMLALNEGHGLARKENRDVYRAAAAYFLHQYLVMRRAPTPAPRVHSGDQATTE